MSWTVPKINIRVEKHGDGDWNGGAQDFQKKKANKSRLLFVKS